jgi:hypothetical protein
VAIKVLRLSVLQDEVLGDLWDDVSSLYWMGKISAACVYEDSNDALQALNATYECSSSVEPREGFLKKDEFLIILAGLQRQLGLDDESFKERISNRDEADLAQARSSGGEVTALDPQKTPLLNLHASAVSEEVKQDVAQKRIVPSAPFNKSSETAVGNNQPYADGFTEYSLAFYHPTPPAVVIFGNDVKSTVVDQSGIGKSSPLQLESRNLAGQFLIGFAVPAPYTIPWNTLLVVHALQNAPKNRTQNRWKGVARKVQQLKRHRCTNGIHSKSQVSNRGKKKLTSKEQRRKLTDSLGHFPRLCQ